MQTSIELISDQSYNVSRETRYKLDSYLELLTRWQKTINLVSKSTLGDAWNRHIRDSWQLYPFLNTNERVIDLGSGGGLPGIVLAILGISMTLIESDIRKAEFLKEVARVLRLKVEVINDRVERQDLSFFGVITARAFAPLNALFDTIKPTLKKEHKLLLLKGKNYQSEIDMAEKSWIFDYDAIVSATDAQSVVLQIKNLHRRE